MFLSTRCENSNQNNLHISDRQNAMSINGSARSDEFWRKNIVQEVTKNATKCWQGNFKTIGFDMSHN